MDGLWKRVRPRWTAFDVEHRGEQAGAHHLSLGEATESVGAQIQQTPLAAKTL